MVSDRGISVVVVTRDRSERLRTCLTGLLSLPERPDVIVVDNGSSDHTVDMVRLHFPDVRLIALPVNLGAVARNVGVVEARTDAVAFTDDDSGWCPGGLERARALLRRHPRLGLISARTEVGPARRLDPISAFMESAPLGRADDLPGPSVLGFLACATIVRRSAFLEVGGFDPVVFFMGEEARVAYDLARAGWGLAYCSDVVAWHEPTPDGSPARVHLAARNQALTSWMRRPIRVALAHSARLLRRVPNSTHARREFRQLLARLPAAIMRRQTPHPRLELELGRLERRHAMWLHSAAKAAAADPRLHQHQTPADR